MTHCVYCGSEAIMFVNSGLVCLECDGEATGKQVRPKCVKCGAETDRILGDVPCCLACDGEEATTKALFFPKPAGSEEPGGEQYRELPPKVACG